MASPNFANRTVWTADCLYVLRGMNSESVDLIYLDPPFNSNANYAAPIGSQAAGAEFKDTWSLSDVDAEWIDLMAGKHPALYRVLLAAMTDSDKSYLAYMAARLLEMRRVLKTTGSIYLHCDPTMSHYLELVMDAIFTKKNFLNEVIWCYKENDIASRWFPRKHDTLFFYGFGDYTFNLQRGPITEAQKKRYNYVIDGERYAWMKGKIRKLKGGGACSRLVAIANRTSQRTHRIPYSKTVSSFESHYPRKFKRKRRSFRSCLWLCNYDGCSRRIGPPMGGRRSLRTRRPSCPRPAPRYSWLFRRHHPANRHSEAHRSRKASQSEDPQEDAVRRTRRELPWMLHTLRVSTYGS